MSTRAEQERAHAQQTGAAGKAQAAARRASGEAGAPRDAPRPHTEETATYALEARDADGHATRKSTRASANRAKPDANLERHQEQQRHSPEARHAQAEAQSVKVRGS